VQHCADVTLLVNNARISLGTRVLAPDALETRRREMETNVFGTLVRQPQCVISVGVS
jgi:hypothetical protein